MHTNSEYKIVKRIVKNAIGILEYDDAHPNVGFGMSYINAVGEAIEDLHNDAKFFGVTVTVTEKMKQDAIKQVREKREN